MTRTIREQTEALEDRLLAPYATRSSRSRGRKRPLSPCDVRTEFQRDRDRILHSKAFRRLKGKTQVFLAPRGDHYRTRLTHTLEVAQIARTIARALRLNEDLTEAIALGHDVGHTPFGHAGESVLDEFHPDGFRHYEQSVRVLDFLEGEGEGLNLTYETLEGIAAHSKGRGPIFQPAQDGQSYESVVVRVSDIIAYLNHDIEDAVRAEILRESELPAEAVQVLGSTRGERIGRMVRDVIHASLEAGKVCMSPEVLAATDALKDFMYERVYPSPEIVNEIRKARSVLNTLIEYYYHHVEAMPPFFQRIAETESREQAVCDYIAGMTDLYALDRYRELFLPRAWDGS
ncbi:MAG: deoxyguanosinetriphosphate triphosphohydrolase-like protein [Candidatus Poribacteria bacterium]|nr:MAG: deoxyguanosinetriphosphate triphosphohydrolase-like protein [Candidatus Poribacteria bacterium]